MAEIDNPLKKWVKLDTVTVLLSALWLFLGVVIFVPPPSPIVFIGGDTVEPAVVKAGGKITVTRNYTLKRDLSFTVGRRMTTGDCPHKCVFYNLQNTQQFRPAGTHAGSLEHTIPESAEPGKYRLEFNVFWENWLGKNYVTPMPVLEIEVVR